MIVDCENKLTEKQARELKISMNLLIALYEKEIAPLDDKRIKYLLAGSNVNEISPNLNKVIVEAMIDEISLVKEVPDMIRKAFLC